MPTSPLDGLKTGGFLINAKELASHTMAAGEDAGTATFKEALRHRASELVGGKVTLSVDMIAKLSSEETQQLFHELHVHQIELEVQNDELRRVQDALHTERERYFDLYELAPVGYCTVSEEGLILQINLTAATLLGTNRGVLLQQPISRLIYREDRDIYYLLCKRLQAGGEPQSNELRMLKDDGTAFWVELLATVVRDESNVSVLRIILNDVTARKQSEQAYRIAAIVFESHEGMTITDANQVILQVNKAFTEITGYTSKDAVGHTPRLLRSGRQDAVFYAEMWRNIARSGAWEGEIWNRRKNGEVFPEWLTITAVKDEKRVVSHYVATHSDITARKAADEQINNLAFYDPLTRLPNRRLLMDRLEQAVAACARHQHKGALMFIDLDGFKTINDTLGHHQGDLLLEQVATRLNTCIRDGDTVARLSGDEFVVMLELLNENVLVAATQAEAVGEKVLSALNHRYPVSPAGYQSTCSIGITLFGIDPAESLHEPLKRADLAMYQAKAAGRNTLRFYEPQMQAVVTARAALEAGLREALAQQQFQLYYQAQIAGVGQLIGVEVLVRWQHPLRGMMLPAEFITLAEETGLIVPLGNWVLETACSQLAAWALRAEMSHLTIAVNVSARQFQQHNFVDVVLEMLERSGANPHRLKLELTESLLVSNIDDVVAKMGALKGKGVSFSLDDFGKGYSSLSHLKLLPLDQLKIDQGFVRDILIDPNDAAIAKMVIALAGSMGLEVIAEGVETGAQRDFLASQDCHAYQGYLFSKPLPLDEFEAFVRQSW